MHPHDYYAPYSDEPKLHNRGAARPYVEPDWQANAAGHQLPVLSTVGRGPRGEGLEIGNVVNEDDTVSFALYSTLTGELVWQSPNLAPSKIEFLPTDFRNLAAGQPALLDIKVTRGGITETTHAYLPCGEQGSLIYTLDAIVPWNRSQTYQTTVNDLIIYGNQHWNNGHKPMPKVNDIIVVKLQEEDKVVLAIADIVQVGSTSEDEIALDSPVVYVVRTTIDNVGPKGDKGDPGEPGEPGRDGIDGDAKTVLMSHAYRGRRISMIPEIADEVAEYDNEWEFLEARMSANDYSNLEVGDFFYVPLTSDNSEIGGMLVSIMDIDYDESRYPEGSLRCVVAAVVEYDETWLITTQYEWGYDQTNDDYSVICSLNTSNFVPDFVNGRLYSYLPPTFLDLLDHGAWTEIQAYYNPTANPGLHVNYELYAEPIRPLFIDDVYGSGNPYDPKSGGALLHRGRSAFFESHSPFNFLHYLHTNGEGLDYYLDVLKQIDDYDGILALNWAGGGYWFADVGFSDTNDNASPLPIGMYQSEGYLVCPSQNNSETKPWSITLLLSPKSRIPNYNNVASIRVFRTANDLSSEEIHEGDQVLFEGNGAALRYNLLDEHGNTVYDQDAIINVYSAFSDHVQCKPGSSSGMIYLSSFDNFSSPITIRSANGVEFHFTVRFGRVS